MLRGAVSTSCPAVSFLGSFSTDDGDSDEEMSGHRTKKRHGGGYGSDDDLWHDLTKDSSGKSSGGGKSSRDRSNDPFIIRSLVRTAKGTDAAGPWPSDGHLRGCRASAVTHA